MPMNQDMPQSIGNEPLAALLTLLAILAAIRMALTDNAATRERLLLPGFLPGLALLAKVSAILIFPPLLLFISLEMLASSGTIRVRTKLGSTVPIGNYTVKCFPCKYKSTMELVG